MPTVNYQLQLANLIKNNLNFEINITSPDWFNISLYDITGKKIVPIYSGNLAIGKYNFNNLIPNTGVYFLVIELANTSENQVVCRKLIAVK